MFKSVKMFKSDRVNLRFNYSVLFIGFLIYSVVGFMFFLSSSFIIPKSVAVLNSDLEKEHTVSGTGKITINSWVYDNNKNEMEVILITKDIKTIDNDLVFVAYQRNGNKQSITAKKVFEEDGIFIIKIVGVAKDFTQVALDVIKESNNNLLDVEKNGDQKNSKNQELLVTLYSDQRKVVQKNIEQKTEKEYQLYLSDVMMKEVERQLNESNQEALQEKDKINKLENEIKLNEEKMVYETDEEKLSREGIINGYKNRIEESNQKLKEIEGRNNLLQEKKAKIEQRKMELKL